MHPPRRILRIQSRICIGGPALNTINLSAGLTRFGYQTILVGGRLEDNEETMLPLAQEKNVEIFMIPEMGRSISVLDDIRALFKLIKLIRQYKPDLVHTHTAKAGALGRLAAFLCRVPFRVHTFHGHVFNGYFSPSMNRLIILTERFLALLTTRIIAISKIQAQDITEKYKITPAKKCCIVPLGFELEKIVNGTKGRFRNLIHENKDTLLIGILARLVPIKNHSFLIESVSHWNQRYGEACSRHVRFLIIGDGDLRKELESQVEQKGLSDLIHFSGWQKNTPDIYADLDLNVLVSKNEGTPVTLIEGIAAGVPILAKDVGGIRDIAPAESGTILPADCTAQDFAEAMQTFIKTPFRLPVSVQCQMRERFDVARLINDMHDVYTNLSPMEESGT